MAVLDVIPQLDLLPLELTVLAPQLGCPVHLLLVDNQLPPRPELLPAVLKDAGALEDLPSRWVWGCRCRISAPASPVLEV